jgi:amino acid transporter
MASTDAGAGVRETELLSHEKGKLQKSLRRFDMLFFTVCALVGLDTLGQVSGYGAETFFWVIALAIVFLLPYALLMAEVGTAFPVEGGPYEWMKLALGRPMAAIGSVMYWISNPFWVGGTLCFLASATFSTYLHPTQNRGILDYLIKLAFIWISIMVAIVSLSRGKWIPNVGAIVRMAVLAFFSVTVVVYGIRHGIHGFAAGDFKPTSFVVFLGLTPLLLFNFVGFELQNGAAEEMQDPQRDIPVSIIRSGLIATLCYAIPILGILLVLPTKAITGIGGFLDAVSTTFGGAYGSAGHFLTQVMACGFIFALVTSGAVWMIGADRVQAISAIDGGFPSFFGVFNAKLGTPVRMNVLSGVISTIFMVCAIQFGGSSFTVVLYITTSLTLICYMIIFPCVPILRRKYPNVARAYTVPGGTVGLWLCTIVCMAWVTLGTWVALFPGLIEQWTGHSYSITDSYGVTRVRFEVFTLVSVAAVIVLGYVGYLAGSAARRTDRVVRVGAATPIVDD